MVKPPFVRSAYNYDTMEASDASGTDCSVAGPSMCQQHFAEECDINTIVSRFGLTGQLPENVSMPRYGDFGQVNDYHSALNLVKAADAAFLELPPDVRFRFENNAGKFVDFCSDPANQAEAVKLGIAVAREGAFPPASVVSAPADSGSEPPKGA